MNQYSVKAIEITTHQSTMEEQKAEFYKLLDDHIAQLDKKKQETFCITQETYEKAVEALQLDKGVKCAAGSHFKFWCAKHFKLQKIGSRRILYCKKTSCPVITKEEIFDTVKRCHTRVGHSRRAKTWDEIKANYSWIRHDLVKLFLSTCHECSTRIPLKKPASGKPIISLGFLTRVQIDLIDMTSRPDSDFKWILHMRDHFSKFSWTHPLTSKRSGEVAEKLVQTFCLFGCPQIMQSDNGREFVSAVINDLCKDWPGMIILHGRPRHPQSQGCVERGNGDLQLKLGKWMEENPDRGWVQGLLRVTYAINTSTSSTTRKSPYEVVFGQPPRTDCAVLEILDEQGIQDEDDLTDLFIQLESRQVEDPINPLTNQTTSDSADIQTTSQPSDSCQEYQLLDGAKIVGTGTKVFGRTTVHGETVDSQHQGVFQITTVEDPDFIPAGGNPFDEPLSVGQFIVWDITQAVPLEPDTPHSKVRKIATDNYLKAANRQQEELT
ncbi:KRAB-A domain-containing protein 2-like [Haliotis rubra]|uniref:KRAB-A domain-containing protein 2-like n=1 Tax=Haliotis rubra TaxID=36100 RepID=UPI001EE5CE0C|nr:KRAB-A domain-containing protein 2-like [Haliotis rubra]